MTVRSNGFEMTRVVFSSRMAHLALVAPATFTCEIAAFGIAATNITPQTNNLRCALVRPIRTIFFSTDRIWLSSTRYTSRLHLAETCSAVGNWPCDGGKSIALPQMKSRSIIRMTRKAFFNSGLTVFITADPDAIKLSLPDAIIVPKPFARAQLTVAIEAAVYAPIRPCQSKCTAR